MNKVPSAPPADSRPYRRNTVEVVLDQIRQRILSGQLRPGEPIRQETLAGELGVSRIPVREAIQRLEVEGLVSIQAHRGAYVCGVSAAEAVETFELRMQVEPWLFGEAIKAGGRAGRLAEAHQALELTLHAEPADWGRANWRLHEALYLPARRELAMSMLKQLHDRGDRYLQFQMVHVPQEKPAYAEHLALIELAEDGDVEAAQRALREHIRVAMEQVVGAVEAYTRSGG